MFSNNLKKSSFRRNLLLGTTVAVMIYSGNLAGFGFVQAMESAHIITHSDQTLLENIDLGNNNTVLLTDQNIDATLKNMSYENNKGRYTIGGRSIKPASEAIAAILTGDFNLKPEELKSLLICVAANLRIEENSQEALVISSVYRKPTMAVRENDRVSYDPTTKKFSGFMPGQEYAFAQIDSSKLMEAYEKLKAYAKEAATLSPVSISDFTKIGNKPGGSVAGAKYRNNKSNKEYIIKYTPENVASNEILSAAFYKKAGLNVPNFILVDPGEKFKDFKVEWAEKEPPHRFVGVEFINGLKPLSAHEQSKNEEVLNGFIVDCWLANYDVVGLDADNIMLDQNGHAIRVDIGASLERKAQGGPKGLGFNDKVQEINFLRGSCNDRCMDTLNLNEEAHGGIKRNAEIVFKNLKWNNIKYGLDIIKNFTDSDIRDIVAKYGPKQEKRQDEIVKMLIERKNTIMTWWLPRLEKEYGGKY